MAEFTRVEGLDVFAQALKLLPKNVARNVLRGSVSAGAKIIADEAKAKAPTYTGSVTKGHPPPGTLKRSIVRKQIKELSDLTKQTFVVAVRKGKKYQKQGKSGNLSQDAFYATWVEFGTSKMAAKPFLRPAFEAKKNEAVDAMAAYIAKRFPDEAKKLGLGWKGGQ
jgi:HK97 gp10 family phage protein